MPRRWPGAAVVVIGEGQLRFPATFTERSQNERVSIWYSVPSFFRQVAERGAIDTRNVSDLRLLMYGGEPYSSGALSDLMELLPGVEVKNVYGPAEVNECTNHTIVRASASDAGEDLPEGDLSTGEREVPIGRPWRGVDLRVVDIHDVDVTAGTAGELLVSSPTVMIGYWRRPELNEKVLVPRSDGAPWYRTGDIVVADEDGRLWFKGRRDHQVKVRGVRIELEGVETVLADAPDVIHAVVGPRRPARGCVASRSRCGAEGRRRAGPGRPSPLLYRPAPANRGARHVCRERRTATHTHRQNRPAAHPFSAQRRTT